MATEPTLQHGGVGSAVVAALCADLESRGCPTGEISWVSNLRFYGKCGARVSRGVPRRPEELAGNPGRA